MYSAFSSASGVVIVTMFDDARLVRELLGLGASAYLVKSATLEELLTTVHAAAKPLGLFIRKRL